MPILPTIGRKRPKIRLAIFLIYTFLIIGSITMVYPFLIMLSGSVKGQADQERMDPVPQVLYSRDMQFARFQEDRYGVLRGVSAAFGRQFLDFNDATRPKPDASELARYEKFLDAEASSFPEHFYVVHDISRNFRILRRQIQQECGTLDEFNTRYENSLSSWNDLGRPADSPLTKEFAYELSNKLVLRSLEYKRKLPTWEKSVLNIDGDFAVAQETLPEVKSGKLEPLPLLSERCPDGPQKALWAEYVKHWLSCLFITPDQTGLIMMRQFMSSRYPGGISAFNEMTETNYKSFDEINCTPEELGSPGFFTLYTQFVTDVCPPEHLIVDTPSTRYRRFVRSQTAQAPFVLYDYSVFLANRSAFLKEVVTRNYVYVLDYIAVYGRAIRNTVIFIGLMIAAALLVNPIAAYALSRYKPKNTYGILMFFLITMAFPSAVTAIPNFLLLKQLHLLNTFYALVLPGLANGFSVFLLKGFFDSIPQEVYESAMIDGAGEWTMFWRFTMALSKPILALMVLNSFTAAYSAFMFALIICPDERMWTIMVWLYQMQQGAAQATIYAALILAAIPTLLMFIFAQNTIMKGIIIPVEK